MIRERWTKMIGYKRDYEISNFGRIRYPVRYAGGGYKEIGRQKTEVGLRCVLVDDSGKRIKAIIARLVLHYFVRPECKGVGVGYIDGDMFNCCADNLYWKLRCGLTESEVVEIRDMFNSGRTAPALANRYGVSIDTIRAIYRYQVWPTAGSFKNKADPMVLYLKHRNDEITVRTIDLREAALLGV